MFNLGLLIILQKGTELKFSPHGKNQSLTLTRTGVQRCLAQASVRNMELSSNGFGLSKCQLKNSACGQVWIFM